MRDLERNSEHIIPSSAPIKKPAIYFRNGIIIRHDDVDLAMMVLMAMLLFVRKRTDLTRMMMYDGGW